MAAKEIKKVGEILIKIGQVLNDNPSFINDLEKFIASASSQKKQNNVDFEKINNIHLFQLIREKSESDVENILSDLTVIELRELLKIYRFGSPAKLKTALQLQHYILNQLRQRKTDVFHNPENNINQENVDKDEKL